MSFIFPSECWSCTPIGSSSPTNWLGRSQRRYLHWSSCEICGPSFLFNVRQSLFTSSFNQCWPCAHFPTLSMCYFLRNVNKNPMARSCVCFGSPTIAECSGSGGTLSSVLSKVPCIASVTRLYAFAFLIRVGLVRLSLMKKVNLLLFQELGEYFNRGIHSGTNLCSGEATAAVCPHFCFISVCSSLSPFECWL